jgi:hypothetical protein
MASVRKIFDAVLSGRSDANIRWLLVNLGFTERIKSSHHIYSRDAIEEILNLQPLPGGSAKPYQVKQVRQIVVKYKLNIPKR